MWFALLVDDVLCDAVAVSGWHDVLQILGEDVVALLVDDVLCDAVAVSGWHDVLQTD